MNVRKALQLLLAGMLAILSVSASEPSYSQILVCPAGQESECVTRCQRRERVFGSYIRVCVFEVEVCYCVAKREEHKIPGSTFGSGGP